MAGLIHLTPGEVSERLRTAEQTLAHWRNKRIGPPFLKFGKRVLYPLMELQAWEKKRMVPCDLSAT